ncbi:MAG TPA: cyclic nucleotide-binding domain-containing protein, partial [Candidatus Limnocylindrales bacterium]|nr:cyclic nucleotide-binding domain-containing protein [Candidatus Limnocylindrales bacterium]
DAYAIVDAGELEVRQADRRIATIGPGDGFGEIALLRSGARTATVVARTAGSIYLIGSPLFLAAVAGPTSAAAARAVVDERLARTSATR